MILNKIYIESCVKQSVDIDSGLVKYLINPYTLELTFKDINLDFDFIVKNLFDSISFHPKL